MTLSTYFLRQTTSTSFVTTDAVRWLRKTTCVFFCMDSIDKELSKLSPWKSSFCTDIWPKNQNVCVFKKARQHQCWWLIDPLGANILNSAWLGSDLVQPINNEISGFELSTPTNEKQHLLLRCCSGGRWVQFPPTRNGWYQYERCFFGATLDNFKF